MPAAATGVLAALAPAGDCDALLDYFIDQALSQVGPYGLGGWGGPIVDAVAEEAATDSAGDGGQPAGGEDPTSTNVQVEGADEGDIVKAAGDHLYVLTGQRLIGFHMRRRARGWQPQPRLGLRRRRVSSTVTASS